MGFSSFACWVRWELRPLAETVAGEKTCPCRSGVEVEDVCFEEVQSRLDVIPDGELVALLLAAADQVRSAVLQQARRGQRADLSEALLRQRVLLSNLLYRVAPDAFARGLLIHEGSVPFVMPPEIPDALPIGWPG